MTAEEVARIGYHGLLKGSGVVIPGMSNKLTSTIARIFPPRFMARIVRRINGE